MRELACDPMKAALLTLALVAALAACGSSSGSKDDAGPLECQTPTESALTYETAYATCAESAAEGRRLAREMMMPDGTENGLDLSYGTTCMALTGDITYSDPATPAFAAALAEKVCPGDVKNLRPADTTGS